MKLRLMLTLAVLASGVMLVLTPGALAAPPAAAAVPIPTTACTLPLVGGAACNVQLTGFQLVNGQVNAVLNIVNTATGQVVSTITTPITGLAQGASCQILDLTIGPINLNLLGLVLTTNQIHLNLTAVPGAGNLLGNLLCAVAGLLDNNNTPLTAITNLLNNILRQGGAVTATPAV